MPTNAATVARSIRLWRDANLSPQAASRVLAGIARRRRDALIAAGEAAPNFTTYVDGREGASEDAVRPDGVILYRFDVLGQAAIFALSFCLARSPVDDGDFRAAWIVAVNGMPWAHDLADIPAGAEVMIVNPKPYARKIDAGHMRIRVPHGIIEAARQALLSRFPGLRAERALLDIPAALGGGYILAGRFRRGFRQHARTRLRSDTMKGERMTYPALVFSARL